MWTFIWILTVGCVLVDVGCLSIVEHVAEPSLVADCQPVTLSCRIDSPAEAVDVWWTFKGENASKLPNATVDEVNDGVWQLQLSCPRVNQSGTYSCFVQARNDTEVVYKKETSFHVYVPISIYVEENSTALDVGAEANLECRVKSHPTAIVQWLKDGAPITGDRYNVTIRELENLKVLATILVSNVTRQDNGTFICRAANNYSEASATQDLLVLEPPEVEVELVEVVDPRTVHIRWNLTYSGNLPTLHFSLQIRNYTTEGQWTIVNNRLSAADTNFTLTNLTPGIEYTVKLSAANDVGTSEWAYLNFTMPPDVPPKVSWLHVLASTNESLLFGWRRPLHDNGANITLYIVQLTQNTALISNDSLNVQASSRTNHMIIFFKLNPGELYSFQVQACNKIGCGNWSDHIEALTLDGVADPPENVESHCYYDEVLQISHMVVTWDIPTNSRGSIQGYNVTLSGSSRYRNIEGKVVVENFNEPHEIKSDQLEFRTVLKPNTNYTVRVGTINRAGCGNFSALTTKTMCSTPPGVPTTVPHFTIQRLNSTDDCRELRLELKRVSERNGLIRCYRVVVVRLKPSEALANLPEDPLNLTLSLYGEVHKSEGSGAYIAEAFNSEHFLKELVLGDGRNSVCEQRKKRHQPILVNGTFLQDEQQQIPVYDGQLSPLTNYTGFIIVQVWGPNNTVLYKSSPYFAPIETGALPAVPPSDNPVAVVFGIVCTILILLLVLLIFLFFMRYKNGSTFFDNREYVGLTAFILRGLQRNGHIPGGKGGTLSKLPCFGPITAAQLPSAFLERHANSDLLFQTEFESLPDKFKDRTTIASDSPENMCKNRYPDIKSYDQTRVKLSPIDGIVGSDYVNANYVEGYKGRKSFICAQGPLPRTIPDFWRMIWENEVSVVVMLTCSEEHGKIKCAQYWSDDQPFEIEKMFVISLLSSRCYSDYQVRRFLVKYAKDGIEDQREILQFHFTMWKDFLAPDQPSWLLRFIKRVNEHYCPGRGPLLVHCSAGVGRTGTLVAIDSLIQQLEEDGQLDIFALVSNLRRHRNFLVQSLKQYIFVYRALMEHAQFNDTEIEILHMKDHYEQMKEKMGDHSGLEIEFQKLNDVIEDPKTACIGTMEMNMSKNRHDFIIPYDMNRVILPPSPYRDQSTYINASFIQGYDRTMSFIITQDPLEATVVDFWRMIYEQSIRTLVTLSEMGEGKTKCQQFWPDDEKEWDYVKVKLESSEQSHNHYIKRVFTVSNVKTSDAISLVHLQFTSWQGVQVPEPPLTLMSLLEEIIIQNASGGPVTIHCSGGGDRSSVVVTLLALIQQLKAEARVDVFETARYTRSQRPCMLQTFGQYEYLYRTLVDYISARNIGDLGDTPL